jgi:hypothetical protein
MRLKLMTILCIAVGLVGCKDTYPGVYLSGSAEALREAQEHWKTNAQLSDLDEARDRANDIFVYTNTVTTSNTVYHCLFGTRDPDWPAGVLAVTDDGIILWVRDRDGNVTVSPVDHGVEP